MAIIGSTGRAPGGTTLAASPPYRCTGMTVLSSRLQLTRRPFDPYELAVPPRDLGLHTGVWMPVVRFDDDSSWRYDSGGILESLGFAPTSETERRALAPLFFASARERALANVRATRRQLEGHPVLRLCFINPFTPLPLSALTSTLNKLELNLVQSG